MLYQKQFSFGILMVRRKKMSKGCREKGKNAEKSETGFCSHWNSLLFSLEQHSLVTEIIFVGY